jgi:hypothetical protein
MFASYPVNVTIAKRLQDGGHVSVDPEVNIAPRNSEELLRERMLLAVGHEATDKFFKGLPPVALPTRRALAVAAQIKRYDALERGEDPDDEPLATVTELRPIRQTGISASYVRHDLQPIDGAFVDQYDWDRFGVPQRLASFVDKTVGFKGAHEALGVQYKDKEAFKALIVILQGRMHKSSRPPFAAELIDTLFEGDSLDDAASTLDTEAPVVSARMVTLRKNIRKILHHDSSPESALKTMLNYARMATTEKDPAASEVIVESREYAARQLVGYTKKLQVQSGFEPLSPSQVGGVLFPGIDPHEAGEMLAKEVSPSDSEQSPLSASVAYERVSSQSPTTAEHHKHIQVDVLAAALNPGSVERPDLLEAIDSMWADAEAENLMGPDEINHLRASFMGRPELSVLSSLSRNPFRRLDAMASTYPGRLNDDDLEGTRRIRDLLKQFTRGIPMKELKEQNFGVPVPLLIAGGISEVFKERTKAKLRK